MVGKWRAITGGLVVIAMLAAGIYIYAESCGSHDKASGSGESCGMDMSSGSHDKHDHSDGKTDATKTPEDLIKQADKLLKEVDKTKDVKPLMTHCQEMMSKSLAMVAECNRALKGEKPDMAKAAGIVETANKLMAKSTELTDKCLSLMPKPAKVEVKVLPHTITDAEVGQKVKCPVTGGEITVTKDTLSAEYKGKVYYFCCSDCPEEFKANPDKFVTTEEKK